MAAEMLDALVRESTAKKRRSLGQYIGWKYQVLTFLWLLLYYRLFENALPLEGDVSTPPLKERMPALSKPERCKDRA